MEKERVKVTSSLFGFIATFHKLLGLNRYEGAGMADLSELGQWFYLLYLLPGGTALLLLLLSALGGGMRHGGMRHGGMRHSGVRHGGMRHGAAKQGAVRHQASPGAKAPGVAAFLGLGRVPGPLVWGSALLGWGVFGFWGTQLWQSVWHSPSVFVLPALGTALVGAFVTEKLTVEAVSRFLPGDETFAVSAVELCGLTGTVVFPVDAARGRVHVYDAHGSLHEVTARTAPGQAALARGSKVLIADYDAARDQLIVESGI